jgi:hypothetical protein
MASEFFWDTSGFFALLNSDDVQHERARQWKAQALAQQRRSITTEWIIGECCTLLTARRRAHLIPRFLDLTERSSSLAVLVSDSTLFIESKAFLRKHLDQGFSFVDCASFVVMRERGLHDALTTDEHFVNAGFNALLR